MKYPFLLLAVFLFFGCTYEEQKYHVYYIANGATAGSPPVDSKDYSSGAVATVLGKGSLVKNDYTFLGWRNYSTTYYEGGKITVYSDTNLYAVWDDGSDTPFSYTVENGEVTITRYNEHYYSTITIPETLQSKPVTKIDNNVFSNSSISGVNLSKNLKSIGVGCFASNNITQLIIPDNVESIGLGAFRSNKLRKVTLGTGINAIAPHTFGNNEIVDIDIPENIVSIETGAFGENNIEMINIGAGVDIKDDTSLGIYGASFKAYYNLEKKAGLYIYASNTWELYD